MQHGWQEIAALLLSQKANPNATDKQGDSPLVLAAKGCQTADHVDLVKILIKAKPSIELLVKARQAAAEQSFHEVVHITEQLIEAKKSSPLLYAVLVSESVEEIKKLLLRGENVNFALSDKTTPLLAASHLGDFHVAQELIHAGADVRAKDKDGNTALSQAMGAKSEDLQAYLQSIVKVRLIPADQLKIGHEVGHGNFGVVFQAEFVGVDHAVKMPKKQADKVKGQQTLKKPYEDESYYYDGSTDSANSGDESGDCGSTPITSASTQGLKQSLHEEKAGIETLHASNHQIKKRRGSKSTRKQGLEYDADEKVEDTMKTFREFLHEAVISEEIGSKPGVVPFRGGQLQLQNALLVYDFMDGGNVEDFLLKQEPSLERIASILSQAATGLWSLHNARVLHRDVAARNFLIDKAGRVSICDFGLSVKLPEGKDYVEDNPVGPFKHNAPESLCRRLYSYKLDQISSTRESHLPNTQAQCAQKSRFSFLSDIYMFGIFMWEAFARMEPYPDLGHREAAARVLREGLRPVIPQNCPAGFSELLEKCWQTDPARRPQSMEEVTEKLKELLLHCKARSQDAPGETISDLRQQLQAAKQRAALLEQQLREEQARIIRTIQEKDALEKQLHLLKAANLDS
eukprot:gb/GEZN01002873.1/.p1 GENE.gb/GEZN01002873.1/~~gb/GEZN01002873.1/.p1  ORF type:complete len:706 (-),score=98.84 gb/GEZN01002873.1/:218-2107(-)